MLTHALSTDVQPHSDAPSAACPNPFQLQFNAGPQNVLNNIFPGDFSAAALLAPRAGLNDASLNKFFLCTFLWKLPSTICRITRSTLTVKMKANQAGSLVSDIAAGNDSISIVRNGVPLPDFDEYVYSNWPFAAGQPAIKTWTLTGEALDTLNAEHRLSFQVRDDTMVQSATLELWGCCNGN